VPGDEGVRGQLERFERVVWRYDGLNGKVIPWTLANGGTSHDPSVQAFVVAPYGKVLSRCEDASVSTPSAIAKWLREQADRWERDHPRTALPLVWAEVAADGEGAARTARCAAVEGAREAGRPVLLWFGREPPPADDRSKDAKARRAEAAAARETERTVLDSKQAAESAKGWTLLRFDLADADHALYARSLGVEAAPALLLIVPGEEKPVRMARPTAADLAFRLRKHAPKDEPSPDVPPKQDPPK